MIPFVISDLSTVDTLKSYPVHYLPTCWCSTFLWFRISILWLNWEENCVSVSFLLSSHKNDNNHEIILYYIILIGVIYKVYVMGMIMWCQQTVLLYPIETTHILFCVIFHDLLICVLNNKWFVFPKVCRIFLELL